MPKYFILSLLFVLGVFANMPKAQAQWTLPVGATDEIAQVAKDGHEFRRQMSKAFEAAHIYGPSAEAAALQFAQRWATSIAKVARTISMTKPYASAAALEQVGISSEALVGLLRNNLDSGKVMGIIGTALRGVSAYLGKGAIFGESIGPKVNAIFVLLLFIGSYNDAFSEELKRTAEGQGMIDTSNQIKKGAVKLSSLVADGYGALLESGSRGVAETSLLKRTADSSLFKSQAAGSGTH